MKSKHLLLLVFFITSISTSFCQINEQDYKNQANEIRKNVWAWNIPAFAERTVPAEYAKYSKIILAKHEEITGLTKAKVKWVGLGLAKERSITYTHTTRQLIKINDAAALDEYSQVSFQKFGQLNRDKLTTFLGVRVIKPDGTIKEIDPDEIVLTNNTNKNQQGKLAISGLQIGDIIDYFIQSVEFYDYNMASNGVFLDDEDLVFADESPMLHYSVHIEANEKLSVVYRNMNGSPDFKMSVDADKNNLLDAEANDIAPFPLDLWVSPYRQIPLTRLHFVVGSFDSHKQGGIYKDLPAEETITRFNNAFKDDIITAKVVQPQIDSKVKSLAESYLNTHGGGKVKESSLSLYYGLRHYLFYQPDPTSNDVNVDQQKNYTSPNTSIFLAVFERLCANYKINAQFVLLPSKYGPKPDQIMLTSDLNTILITEDNHIYSCESIFDVPDQVPYYLEGQQGITLDYTLRWTGVKSTEGTYNTKYSAASKNMDIEDISCSFDPSNPQKMSVTRKTTLTGLMKLDEQKQLTLFEDVYDDERKEMGLKKSFFDELNDSHKGKKISDEYQNAFTEARNKWKDYFTDEITGQFDMKPEDLTNYKVDQSGIFDGKPDFIYSSQFSLNAWIKKAGNNFIIDAGKIIGPQLQLKPEQRDRKIDVYMSNARTFQYNIQIVVPAGYTVEGLDKLNTKVDNDNASFITTAKVENGFVKISVTKIYKNAFVQVAKWNDLVTMIDACDAFENTKLLFKKS